MLVNTKARVGVFSIALGAYLPQFPSLVPEFEAQYEAFKKTIPDTVEIIDGGMVTTKEQSIHLHCILQRKFLGNIVCKSADDHGTGIFFA